MMKKIITLIISCVLLGQTPYAEALFGFFEAKADITDGQTTYTSFDDFDSAYAELFMEETPKEIQKREQRDKERIIRDKETPSLSDYAESLDSIELSLKQKIESQQAKINTEKENLERTKQYLKKAIEQGKTTDTIKYEKQINRDIEKLQRCKDELDALKNEFVTNSQKFKRAKNLIASQEHLETTNERLNSIEPQLAVLNNRKKRLEEFLQKATSETRKKELQQSIKEVNAEIAKIDKEAKVLEKKLYGEEQKKAGVDTVAGLGLLDLARKLFSSHLPSAISSRTGLILGGLGVTGVSALGYLGYNSYRKSAIRAEESQKQTELLKKQLETTLELQKKSSQELKKLMEQKEAMNKEKALATAIKENGTNKTKTERATRGSGRQSRRRIRIKRNRA